MWFQRYRRLTVLLSIAAAVWGYAIITDRPAPAWGQSQLPEMLIGALLLTVIALPIYGICRIIVKRRG
jgi:hypothetical protein